MQMLIRFLRDDAGLETVEYGIIAGLIVGASLAFIVALGMWVHSIFSDFQTEVGS